MSLPLALPTPLPQPLSGLLAELTVLEIAGDTSCLIDHQTCDSRQARPGSLFVAYRGVALDSHRFVADAAARVDAASVVECDPAGCRSAQRRSATRPARHS